MFVSSRRQKGRKLEKFVAEKLEKIYPFAYSRADSGAGKFHKEDITLPSYIPLHLECKNHAQLHLKDWWGQTLKGCPANKIPVLIYKLPFQDPMVYWQLDDMLGFLARRAVDTEFHCPVTIQFDNFCQLLVLTKSLYEK